MPNPFCLVTQGIVMVEEEQQRPDPDSLLAMANENRAAG